MQYLWTSGLAFLHVSNQLFFLCVAFSLLAAYYLEAGEILLFVIVVIAGLGLIFQDYRSYYTAC